MIEPLKNNRAGAARLLRPTVRSIETCIARSTAPVGGWSLGSLLMQKLILFRLTAGLAVVVVAATAAAWEVFAADLELPPGVKVTSESKTHVHANISALRTEDFPALAKIHALYTVYLDGDGATDEKMKALAQLRFTNLVCVVFTDCPLVTDKGIEHLSQIPTLHSLGLRQMAVTDAACDTMTKRMRLRGANMPNCTNVTVGGLLTMAQSERMESLGFSVGQMTQADLIRIIQTAGPKLSRLDIEMVEAAEGRLDFPALRQVAEAKKIRLFAVRNRHVKKL